MTSAPASVRICLAAALIAATVGACTEADPAALPRRPSPAQQSAHALAPQTLPDGVERLSLSPAFFSEANAPGDADDGLQAPVDLVPPVPYPRASERHHVRVVVRLPKGKTLDVTPKSDESEAVAPTLQFPAGTWLARVESIDLKRGGTAIVDVRGTRIDADGETFYVLRPAAEDIRAPLLGLAWKRDDTTAEARAHERLAETMRTTAWGFLKRPAPDVVDKRASHFVSIGRCSACHARARPDFMLPEDKGERTGFFPRRGTDENGYYAPASLFRVAQPVENYGKVAPEAAFLTTECAPESDCVKGSGFFHRLDLAAAHRRQSPHASAVCASRSALHALAAPAAKRRLAALLPACAALAPNVDDATPAKTSLSSGGSPPSRR